MEVVRFVFQPRGQGLKIFLLSEQQSGSALVLGSVLLRVLGTVAPSSKSVHISSTFVTGSSVTRATLGTMEHLQSNLTNTPNDYIQDNACKLFWFQLGTNFSSSGTIYFLNLRLHIGVCGWGVEWSSSNLKVGSSIPSLPQLHAEVSLGKMLNPELQLIEQQSASNRCTVWMCVWMGECKTVL